MLSQLTPKSQELGAKIISKYYNNNNTHNKNTIFKEKINGIFQ